jgi:hypothetical protein
VPGSWHLPLRPDAERIRVSVSSLVATISPGVVLLLAVEGGGRPVGCGEMATVTTLEAIVAVVK